jgi:hypothetical protein
LITGSPRGGGAAGGTTSLVRTGAAGTDALGTATAGAVGGSAGSVALLTTASTQDASTITHTCVVRRVRARLEPRDTA